MADRGEDADTGEAAEGENTAGMGSPGATSSTATSEGQEDSGSVADDTGSTTDGEPPVVECDDGIDNDGDGLVDWGLDLGCVSQGDLSEGGVPTMDREDGWTVFEPSEDTRIVFVSQSLGDDAFDGSAPVPGPGGTGPVRSLAAAASMIRSGSADWLLLKRGDVWDEGLGAWTASGRSPDAPIVIASYGDSTVAPVVRGDIFLPAQEGTRGGPDNVAIAHLRFENAAVFGQAGSDILVEGCHFTQGLGAVVVEGATTKRDGRFAETPWTGRRPAGSTSTA